MQKPLICLLGVVLIGCSAGKPPEVTGGQYCLTDENIRIVNNEAVSSETNITCTDRPKVNHVTRSAGVAGECRSYRHKIQRGGVTKNVKGFLCRFPNGTWEPVNDVYSY